MYNTPVLQMTFMKDLFNIKKKYRREWKKTLVSSINPSWRDLTEDFEPDK